MPKRDKVKVPAELFSGMTNALVWFCAYTMHDCGQCPCGPRYACIKAKARELESKLCG